MSSSLTTWNLPWGSNADLSQSSTRTFYGSIISFEPSVTAFALTCSPGCDDFSASYTVGPWAQMTPPPQASAGGTYQVNGTEPLSGATFSIGGSTETTSFPAFTHTWSMSCTVTSTSQLGLCNDIDNYSGSHSALFTSQFNATDPRVFGITPIPVTITAGLEKIASVSATTTASGSQATGTSSGASGTASETAKASGNAVSSVGPGSVKTMGLLGLVAAMFVL